ncbi:MAG TPA: sensor histidine kinase [Mycobacterium sp.]|uniref:sensor histidine kinase n=1 Tax=Mycobacterium sp. TaxID=1785 RepID=UPI002D41CC41|nr:sensor histidine kinase [Mycobacterium sp.]HZU49275.1 sensor histidine kinase [Mycobacterium sp.]
MALFYRSEREYLDSLVPLISGWLSNAEPVLVAVPEDKIALLQDAFGAPAGDVTVNLTMTDITEAGRNPGRILGLVADFMQRHPHRPLHMIGEPVWPGRSDVEYPACVQHEALVNIALAGHDVTGLCLYDASRLGESVLADARLTHPLIWRDGWPQPNRDFALDLALDHCNQPLPTDAGAMIYTVCEPADLAGARRCSARYGRLLGLSDEGIADLQLITTELATSGLHHSGGACRIAFWHSDGHVVCEARYVGQLGDPLAGCRPPTAGSGECELFVVNAVADLVRTHTSPDGTTIHAYLRLDRFSEGGAP